MILRVYTDGACSYNPGPGGWACLFLLPDEVQLISGGAEKTTNNRMELMAVCKSMEMFIDRFSFMDNVTGLEINSDSAYIVNSLNQGWVERWKQNKWCTSMKRPVKNYDLWRTLLKYRQAFEWLGMTCEFVKVEGHAGIECNEIVDKAAREEVERIKRGEKNG